MFQYKKMLEKIILTTILVYLFIASIFNQEVMAQSEINNAAYEYSITNEVILIVEKTCSNCHASPGKSFAMAKLNLDEWNTYTSEEKVKQAINMCYMIDKNKMPPKRYIKRHSENKLTQEEEDTICKWAMQLEAQQHKKNNVKD